MGVFVFLLVFGMPIMALLFFIVSLIDFIRAPKDSQKREEEKRSMIWCAVVFGVSFALILGLMFVLSNAVVNM